MKSLRPWTKREHAPQRGSPMNADAQSDQAQAPIRISFRSVDKVFVEAEQEDRFLVTQQEASKACQQAQHAQDWLEKWRLEFDALLKTLADWAANHADNIDGAFLVAGNDGLEVFIATSGSEYRDDLDDAITDLDIEINAAYPLCPTDIMHFPSEPGDTRHSFFSVDRAIQVWPLSNSTQKRHCTTSACGIRSREPIRTG